MVSSHPLRRLLPLLAALLPLGPLGAAPALAMPPAVHRALLALQRYEAHSVEALGPLAELEADRSAPSADRREAAFLRTAVSADLWLLSELDARQALRAQLARHWGLPEAQLPDVLLSRLRRISFGVYAEPARDAAAALEHLLRDAPFTEPPTGDRAGLLYAREVLEAASRPDPLESLVALAPDPCPPSARRGPESGPETRCPSPEARFGPRGRRAAAALRAAGRHLTRCLEAAHRGDPLCAALHTRLAHWRERLQRVVLAAAPRLPDALPVAPAPPTHDGWAEVDVLLVVDAKGVSFGAVPRLTFDGREPTIAPGPVAQLPELERIPLPETFRPAIRPLPDVQRALAATRTAGVRRFVFGAAAGTPAHILARVLRSAVAADLEPVGLLVADAHRTARLVPVNVVPRPASLMAGEPGRALQVRVRLGGFTLRAGRRVRDLPRVRSERGLRFDFDALVSASRDGRYQRTVVEYMTAAPSEVVIGALVHLAAPGRPVALLLP